jgi:hypothetical protein
MKIYGLNIYRNAFPALLIICFIASPGYSQRKYFEYNNPNAIVLNSENLKLLIGRTWYETELIYIMRSDTTKVTGFDQIHYNKDGTFTSAYGEGTWEIKYRKYIIQKIPERSKYNRPPRFDGIFSVTTLGDSSLTLEKTLTSSQDMKRIFSFSLKGVPRQIFTWVAVKNPFIEKAKLTSEGVKNPFIDKAKLTEDDIDSLSHFTDVQAFTSGVGPNNTEISVVTPDSVYVIQQKVLNEIDRLKIFKSEEILDLPWMQNLERFTPTEEQIRIADQSIKRYLSDTGYSSRINFQYLFRQYVGYLTDDGESIIFLNVYCWYSPRWRREIVKPYSQSFCCFSIKYKLESSECFDFEL